MHTTALLKLGAWGFFVDWCLVLGASFPPFATNTYQTGSRTATQEFAQRTFRKESLSLPLQNQKEHDEDSGHKRYPDQYAMPVPRRSRTGVSLEHLQALCHAYAVMFGDSFKRGFPSR